MLRPFVSVGYSDRSLTREIISTLASRILDSFKPILATPFIETLGKIIATEIFSSLLNLSEALGCRGSGSNSN